MCKECKPPKLPPSKIQFAYKNSYFDDYIIVEEKKYGFAETVKKPNFIERLFGITWEEKLNKATNYLIERFNHQEKVDNERYKIIDNVVSKSN